MGVRKVRPSPSYSSPKLYNSELTFIAFSSTFFLIFKTVFFMG